MVVGLILSDCGGLCTGVLCGLFKLPAKSYINPHSEVLWAENLH